VAAQGLEVVEQPQHAGPRQTHAQFLGRLADRRRHGVLARLEVAARQGEVAGVAAQGERAAGQEEGGPLAVRRDHDRHCRRPQALGRQRAPLEGGEVARQPLAQLRAVRDQLGSRPNRHPPLEPRRGGFAI
jgi:hypothetical protein